MGSYNKRKRDTTAKLNGMFDDMFKNMGPATPGSDPVDRINSEFNRMFKGGPTKKAGDPPAIKKKDMDPIDRKILGLKNMIADPGASKGEKETAVKLLARLEAKKARR